MMTYEQALQFWFGRINYEQRIPKPADLKLDRMRGFLQRLGNQHKRLRVVHVAGSKGKGSTSAMIAAILQQAGYRTGLFTSPHLCSVLERIQVDGRPIARDELACLASDVQDAIRGKGSGVRGQEASLPNACERPGADEEKKRGPELLSSDPWPLTPDPYSGDDLEPTFFEVATALGFLHFVRRRVDVAVLEVGLGGRFDATNVCEPEVALITSISLDHIQQLGDRLEMIAMEKAGIVKPGRPAVSGATAPEAAKVIEQICRERQAPLRQLNVDFRYRYWPGQVRESNGKQALAFSRRPRVQITTRRRAWPCMELSLLGEHQAANAAVAVASIEILLEKGWHISDEAVKAGLASVNWPARLEVVAHQPTIVLDCAHNVASAHALVETLKSSFRPSRRLLIFASSNDKDVPGIVREVGPHFSHAFVTRYGTTPRSLSPDDLAALLGRNADLPFSVCANGAAALEAAQSVASPNDLICITGSVFLAGELRPLLVPGLTLNIS
jgi:dihydrofolate synthase/folylpolyglutamate synthase